jgi:integrase
MGRPRSPKRKNWPAYMHEPRPGYYTWRHPKTKEEFGLGSDFKKACLQAQEANLKLADLLDKPRLVDRIERRHTRTVADWCLEFRAVLERRGLAANTIKNNESKLRAIEASSQAERPGLGDLAIDAVTTKQCADFLKPWIDEGKDRSVVSLRSTLDDLFRSAAGAGWVKENPVAALTKFTAKVKRARLSLDDFKAIHAAAAASGDPWEVRLLELAIVTAQARECLVAWEFADEHDGFLWSFRGKTGVQIKLPLELAVPKLGWRLDETIKRCRDRVLSKHLVHHTRKYAYNTVGGAVFIDTATKAFARARDASGLTWGDKQPPTLHEVRSLALRLYRDAYGRDFAQALAGHKDGSTTDIYTDVRGSEWIEVRFG